MGRSGTVPGAGSLWRNSAACGAQAPTRTAILPLEELPGGLEGPNVLEDTGTSVVIQFTSGVPTMCNVAYGADTDYGSLATMPMMSGAVREHAVTLTGLRPNTTYHLWRNSAATASP